MVLTLGLGCLLIFTVTFVPLYSYNCTCKQKALFYLHTISEVYNKIIHGLNNVGNGLGVYIRKVEKSIFSSAQKNLPQDLFLISMDISLLVSDFTASSCPTFINDSCNVKIPTFVKIDAKLAENDRASCFFYRS